MLNTLLLTIAVTWPLGQLAILPTIHDLPITILDLLTTLLWLVLILKFRSKIPKDPLFSPLVLFEAICVLSLALNLPRLSQDQSLIAFAYLLRFISSTSVYFAIRIQKTPPKLLIVSLISFTLLGLLQYLFFPDMRSLKNLGFDDHYFRLIGTLFDPNFTGLILSQITLIAIYFLKKRQKLFALLPLTALALTFSRASYLAFVVGCLYLPLKRKTKLPKIYFLGSLATLVIFIWLTPKPFGEGVNLLRTFSVNSRLVNQQYALGLFLQKPLFGWGFNTLKPTSDIYPNRSSGVDNSFLLVLATTGVLGFSAFINLLYRLWYLNRTNVLFTAILLTVLVHSFTNNSFFFLWETIFFWIALALASPRVKS